MELKEAKKLPPLRNNGTTLSLLFAGARREMVIDYKILLELLKIFVYPTLKKLKVALVGPSLDGEGSLANTNDIEVQATKQTIEYLYKTSAALSKFDVIYTVSPGFTDNLDQWTPAVKLFTESNIPLVFTGYSSFDKKDNDALFDEDCLLTYFRAISIVPNTWNPCSSPTHGSSPPVYSNRYYFITQGIDENKPFIERIVFKKKLSCQYLLFQSDFWGPVDQSFGKGCLILVERLESGEVEYTHQTMAQLIRMAKEIAFTSLIRGWMEINRLLNILIF